MPENKSPLKEYMQRESEVLGEAWVTGYLIDLGGCPGLILTDNPLQKVHGYLLQLKNPAENLKVLDDYEEINSAQFKTPEYKRISRHVNWSNTTKEAWMYISTMK
jgi:gamma-glutamylcyclotransferase (GGCT)/AIG2-like uncharacterized protein YtfP